MDMGGMRKWLKEHDEQAMMIVRKYKTLVDEQEVSVHEYRLMLLMGEMDYTTYALAKASDLQADEAAARQKAIDRAIWETKRDTGRDVDPERALANGQQYMKEQK